MKKMIRDRVIFIVISCIALAGMIYWCNATAPAVTLKTEYHAELGTQAAVSFSNFFEEAQDWYDSYPAGEEFTMTLDADYEPLLKMFAAVSPYLTTAQAVTDEALLMELSEYSSPLMGYIMNYPLTVAMLLESYGSFTMDVESWTMIGDALEEAIVFYQS